MAFWRNFSFRFREAVVLGFFSVSSKQRRDFHNLEREVNVGVFKRFRLDQSDGGGNDEVVAIGVQARKGQRIRSTGIKDVLALNVASKEVKHL